MTHTYRYALDGYAARLSPPDVATLRADPAVAYVRQERRWSALAEETSVVPQPDQFIDPAIRRVYADRSRAAGKGRVDVDIAILDSGIDAAHPDLNVVGGVDCINSGIGFDDVDGHGTFVAGIAAARDNTIGLVGVAPGARLWAVKVADPSGAFSDAAVLCGIDWVTEHARVIEVANMSFGGQNEGDDGHCGRINHDPMHLAIWKAVASGVTMTASAGNDAADVAASKHTPASYDEVITVSALADYDGRPGGKGERPAWCLPEVDDTMAFFSNYGRDVDVIAPGLCVSSTWAADPAASADRGVTTPG